MSLLTNARGLSHEYGRRVVQTGDTVIDATMGNGNDTLFLCELVGESGCVHAFDIQEEAYRRTKEKINEAGYQSRVCLHLMGHQEMESVVEGPVSLVMFNLGYLPAGDKKITTLWENTQKAVEAALRLLKTGGLLLVCIYPGHEEGSREKSGLIGWAQDLPQRLYNVLYCEFSNQKHDAPSLLIVQKE